LLYTGKGGAGKTTIAAATAVRCAETNRRTLLLGCDTSESLADCLNTPLSGEPPAANASFVTASTFLVDGGISAAYVTPE